MRRVYLDTCVVIYLIENVSTFSARTRKHLERNGDAVLCVSPLVRMEVLAKPLRDGNQSLMADYEDFLAEQRWLSIDDRTFDLALELRGLHGLRTPDALHLALARLHGCAEFWTNDHRLGLAAGPMAVNVLQDTTP